jgi:hypothetical protein
VSLPFNRPRQTDHFLLAAFERVLQGNQPSTSRPTPGTSTYTYNDPFPNTFGSFDQPSNSYDTSSFTPSLPNIPYPTKPEVQGLWDPFASGNTYIPILENVETTEEPQQSFDLENAVFDLVWPEWVFM